MKRTSMISRAAAGMLAALATAGTALADDIRIFTRPHSGGAEIILMDETPDVAPFHDRAREDRVAIAQARREEALRQEEARRYGRGALDIFPDRDFGGNAIRFERDTERLGRRSDNAASMIVHQGVWELCTEPRFEGRCRVFEPGRYASLGRLDDRVASLRQLR